MPNETLRKAETPYFLRQIPGFETLKAFRFGPKQWRCIDCVEYGDMTDPYFANIGEWCDTYAVLIAYARENYNGQYK